MNRLAIKLALCGLLLACDSTFSQGIDWQSDLDQAKQIARSENKLILMHFSADWCRPCKELETFVFASERVAKTMGEKVIAVEINTDHHPDLVKEFEVGEIPMDIVITESGRVVSKRNSPKNADDYHRMLASLPSAESANGQASRAISRKFDQVVAATSPEKKVLENKKSDNLFQPAGASHTTPAASIESQDLMTKTDSNTRLVDHETVNEFQPANTPPATAQNQAPAALRVINDKFFSEKSNAQQLPAQQQVVQQQPKLPQQQVVQQQQPTQQPRIAMAPQREFQKPEEVIRQPMTSLSAGDNSFRPTNKRPMMGSESHAAPAIPQTPLQPQLVQQPTQQTRPVESTPMKTQIASQPRQLGKATIDNPFRSSQQAANNRIGRSAARILEPNFNQDRTAMNAQSQVDTTTASTFNPPQALRENAQTVAQSQTVERPAAPTNNTGSTTKPGILSPGNATVVPQNQTAQFVPQRVATNISTGKHQNPLLAKLQKTVDAPKAQTKTETEVFVLNGKCPVTLIRDGKWEEGKREIGCVHRGRVYLFSSQENLKVFQASPETFSPILAGYDPVVFHDEGELVDGNEKHGVFMGKAPNHRIVLFKSAATRARFQASPKTFMTTIKTAVRQSDRKLR